MKKRKHWKPEELNQMLQLYRDGVSTKTLANNYGVSVDAIRQQTAKRHVYRTADTLSSVRREARKGNDET